MTTDGMAARVISRSTSRYVRSLAVPTVLIVLMLIYQVTKENDDLFISEIDSLQSIQESIQVDSISEPIIEGSPAGAPVPVSPLKTDTIKESTGPPKRPNVIILLADDMGMGDLSINNVNSKLKTPYIDSIGHEGINFLDGHSASTKCSPSRYGLMTGRHSFLNIERAGIRKLHFGTPHLATMFNRNGYKTGIVGKTAPIEDHFEGDADQTLKDEANRLFKEWSKKLGGGTGVRAPHESKRSFWMPANYSMSSGAHTYGYDYAFLNQYACCRVGGGFFLNGQGVQPFTKYGIQRPYPEGSKQWQGPECQEYLSYDGQERCGDKPFANGYVGPPYFDERTDGPVLVPNFPPSILVQDRYDSRTTEARTMEVGLDFIKENANKEDPFFIYFGFRSGHNPFNSDPKYRGKSGAGEIGEAIQEMDDNVGQVLSLIKELGIDDDTVVIFMSDNGAITRGNAEISTMEYPEGSYLWDVYRHYQNSITIDGKWHKFNGGKNSAYEGGHRMPFLWRYPRLIKTPREERESHVSYLDVFRTLGDLIGDFDLPCNEAPDSRSLLPLLKEGGGTEEERAVFRQPHMQHSVFQGTRSIRDGQWKLISGSKELFNLEEDMEELNNLYKERPDKVKVLRAKLDAMVKKINARELRTDEGRKPGVC